MSSSEPPKLSLDDILAFCEAELVEYMKRNRRPDGSFDLEFEGWENLLADQRDQLAERLRAGAQKASDEVQSRPADADQIAARLHEIADKDESSHALTRQSRYERPRTLSPQPHLEEEFEMDCYNDLVKDGCAPPYPIGLLGQVTQNPAEYLEILRPWQIYPDTSTPKWENVFRKQLRRWQDFRRWQRDNRGMVNEEELFAAFVEEQKRRDAEGRVTIWRHVQMTESQWLEELRAEFKRRQDEKGVDDEDEGFSAFVEKTKQYDLKHGLKWPGMTEDEYLQTLRSEFDREQSYHYWDNFYWLREDHGRGGFDEYVKEVKRRLASHGFTRTCQFDEDPTRQDKLTTWIEYLNYEYSWYDRYARSLKRLQPEYDAAWKKLVDSGVLRPGETAEYLRSDESGFRRQAEQDQAVETMQSAEAAAKAALRETVKSRTGRSNVTKQERMRRLAAAHSRVVAAQVALKATKRRGDLITNFVRAIWDYDTETENVQRHKLLLQWILEQVPQIEVEQNESKVAENRSHAGPGGRKSRRAHDNKSIEDGKPTRRRRRDEIKSLSNGAGSVVPAREPPKRGRRDDTTEDERPSKRLRSGSQGSNSHQAAMDIGKVSRSHPPRSTDVLQPPAVFPQLRRSARIAARQDSRRNTITPSRAVKNSRQRRCTTHAASATSQDGQLRSKGRATIPRDSLSKAKPTGISKRRRS